MLDGFESEPCTLQALKHRCPDIFEMPVKSRVTAGSIYPKE
jgi:hypothetical protein